MSVTSPIPEGARLLHIGVPKTGTTALQDSLSAAREELSAAGVTYPGDRAEHSRAALAVLGQVWGWRTEGRAPTRRLWWDQLLGEVDAAPGRVMISSEFFCEADDAQTAEIVGALDPRRLHVIVTLRPLSRLLPSCWQQYLKGGLGRTYPEWLQGVLADPPDQSVTPSFWRRHDHGAVVQRWADALGPDRVTVLLLDEADRSLVPRTFEAMLGLPAGRLDPRPDNRSNRSLTAAECELLRRVNLEVRQLGLTWADYEAAIRKGMAMRMVEEREPGKDEPRVATPQWALDTARQLGAAAAATIGASGVQVLGRLDSLVSADGLVATGQEPAIGPPPMDAAVAAVVGAAMAAATQQPDEAPHPEKLRLEQLRAVEIARVLRSRTARRLTRRLHRRRVRRVST